MLLWFLKVVLFRSLIMKSSLVFFHGNNILQVQSVSSVAQSCPTLCNPMDCSTPGLPVHHQLPELTQTHVHRVTDAIQPSHPVTPFSCLQSFPTSGSFPVSQFCASGGPSIKASDLASVFSMNIQDYFPLDWFDLLAVEETLRSLLWHHSSKTSVLWCSALFMVQFSNPYIMTGKTIALTIHNFVCKGMSLLFNTLFRFVISFLPRSKCLLASWLQSTVLWEPGK